jgi:hypothetical protein
MVFQVFAEETGRDLMLLRTAAPTEHRRLPLELAT